MKKVYLNFITLLFIAVLYAQNNQQQIVVCGQVFHTNNYDEIVSCLDNYWANNPNKFNKGSGYKVYQRWKEHWSLYLNEDRTLMTESQKSSFMRNTNNKGIDTSVWTPLGPFTHVSQGSWSNGQGRINVVCVDPNNSNTIYIGSPNGGIWKSTDAGTTWSNKSDYLPTIGVSGIAVDYNNSDIIYISTGDEDANANYSSGIYKSIDGGNTWTLLHNNVGVYSTSGEIYISPTNSNHIWYVTSSGLFKTTDGGVTWSNPITSNLKEIRLKPGNPNVIYVVDGSGTTRNIRKSTDGGDTFSIIKSYTNTGRIVIDVTPANAEYLYVLVSNSDNSFQRLDRSTDSGATFTTMNSTTNIYENTQAFYDLAIAASTVDANIIYTGCLNVWKSTDGGTTLIKQNNWSSPTQSKYTHADIHDIKFFNEIIYVCSDGGIYVSTDAGTSFVDKTINGINISQFYRIDVAQNANSKVVGGLQDNGGFSLNNNNWVCFHGVDGVDAAVNPTNSNSVFGFTQHGVELHNLDTSNASNSGTLVANIPNEENGRFITPLEFGNSGTLYSGFKKLYKLNSSSQWEVASTYSSTSNLKIIRVSPDNDYKVLIFDGNTLKVSDGSSSMNFTTVTAPTSGWLGNILNFDFNRNNSSIYYVVTNNAVYKTTNSGATYTDITYNLPSASVEKKVAIIHQASSINNTLYLATAKSVYFINDSMTEWQLYRGNLPNTTITDIEVNNIENTVFVSTFGRGVWRSPVTPSSLGVEEINETSSNLAFYPNPVNEIAKLNTNINEKVILEIYNLSGQLVYKTEFSKLINDTEINLSFLGEGTYVANFTSEHHLISKKFIKK